MAGGFGLRRAPRPATLLRLAETFGAGPDGTGRPRVHLCLADAAVRASRAAAEAVRAAERRAGRRRASAGVYLTASAAAAATEATEGLPATHFTAAARHHLSEAIAAAAADNDLFTLAEYHFVAGKLAAADENIVLAEEHYQAAADATAVAEAQATPTTDSSGVRLTAAAVRAALADIRLSTVVLRADAELEAGKTAALVASLAPLLLPSPAGAGGGQGGEAPPPVLLTPAQREAGAYTRPSASQLDLSRF